MQQEEPNFLKNLHDELSDGKAWLGRAIVMGYAAMAGLAVVVFTIMSEQAYHWFSQLYSAQPLAVLIWTPALTAAIVWLTRRYAPGAAGSGIPQVMATLDPALPASERGHFVSLKLTFAKMVLGTAGMLAGLSMGREGP
ncbi:MAG: chloride channel protein, partial [Burkholderiaceae bacterium]